MCEKRRDLNGLSWRRVVPKSLVLKVEFLERRVWATEKEGASESNLSKLFLFVRFFKLESLGRQYSLFGHLYCVILSIFFLPPTSI